jgi:hypothetical protein
MRVDFNVNQVQQWRWTSVRASFAFVVAEYSGKIEGLTVNPISRVFQGVPGNRRLTSIEQWNIKGEPNPALDSPIE